jgi:hypothetical protein
MLPATAIILDAASLTDVHATCAEGRAWRWFR